MFYCSQDKTLICQECLLESHLGHQIESAKDKALQMVFEERITQAKNKLSQQAQSLTKACSEAEIDVEASLKDLDTFS